jgi:hypothetical protein
MTSSLEILVSPSSARSATTAGEFCRPLCQKRADPVFLILRVEQAPLQSKSRFEWDKCAQPHHAALWIKLAANRVIRDQGPHRRPAASAHGCASQAQNQRPPGAVKVVAELIVRIVDAMT